MLKNRKKDTLYPKAPLVLIFHTKYDRENYKMIICLLFPTKYVTNLFLTVMTTAEP